MAKTTFKVEGLADLSRALGELPKATGRNVLRRVGKKALEPVAEAMRQDAPEGLKDEIIVTTKRPTGGAKEPRKSEVEVFAGPVHSKKAHLVEFGTAPHVIRARRTNKGGKMVFHVDGRVVASPVVQHPGAAPQPYARPAWDEESPYLPAALAKDLGIEIQKAADRLARKQSRLLKKSGGYDTRGSKG